MAFKVSFTRGETIGMALEIIEGNLATAVVRSVLKKASKGQAPSEIAPELLVFDVEYVSSLGAGLGAGWKLTADSEDLSPGDYFADGKITTNGETYYTEPYQIVIKPRVTT